MNGEIWYDKIITDKYYSISNKLKKHTLENLENNLGDKMQIAVCDDQKVCLNILLENIKKCLDDLGKDYLDTIVDTYVSGESLIQAFKKGKSYDLIYLDIKMSNLNGFETAKVLRDIDNRVIIIFVTSLTDYIFNCFEYRPFWFITKPINEEKFKYVFFKAITAIRNSKTKEYSFFTRENGLISLELSKIIYLESVLRRIIIVTPTQQYTYYANIKEEEEKLIKYDFVRIHRSYLVNMCYIQRINKSNVVLKNNVVLPLSEHRYKTVFDSFTSYLARCSV